MPAFRTPVGVRRWHTGRLCLVPPCPPNTSSVLPQLRTWSVIFWENFFLIYLKGLKIYGFCSQVQQLSLPVLRIHPQFCQRRVLDQWFFEKKKMSINLKGFKTFGFFFIHKFNNYLSLSSAYILSSATAAYLTSDFLRKKIVDQFKRIQNLWVFFFHKFNTYHSLSSEYILSSVRVFKRHTIKQWDFKKKSFWLFF